MQQTTSTYGVRLDRYARQRDEWSHSLQMLMTPAIEQVMRKLYRAAEIYVQMRPKQMALDEAYSKLMERARNWSDEELRVEFGEKRVEDADVCLQMTVKSHATVLALATARKCRQVISVPSILKFFRSVLEVCASELSQPDLFLTTDIDTRAKVRRWIDQIVSSHAMALVPVGLFAKCSTVEEPPIQAIRKAEAEAEGEIDEEEEEGAVAMPLLRPDTALEPSKPVEVSVDPQADLVKLESPLLISHEEKKEKELQHISQDVAPENHDIVSDVASEEGEILTVAMSPKIATSPKPKNIESDDEI